MKTLKIIGATILGLLLIGLILQVFVKPTGFSHPFFPYISLNDRDLPFFNKADFEGDVFSWYSLDDYIGSAIAHHRKPFLELEPEHYYRLLTQKATAANKSQVPMEIETVAQKWGADPLTYNISTDNHGFRYLKSDPLSIKKNPNDRVLKIVALGDSLTFGFGVGAEKSWPYLLKKGLRETYIKKAIIQNPKSSVNFSNIEVINAGVIAYDSNLGKLLLKKKVLPLKPNWVIIGYGFNDYNFKNDIFNTQPQAKFYEQIIFQARRIRLFQIMDHLSQTMAPKQVSKLDFEAQYKRMNSLKGQHQTSLRDYKKNMEDMIKILKREKINILLLNSNITSPIYTNLLKNLGQKHKVTYADFGNFLKRALKIRPEKDLAKPVEVLFRLKVPKEDIDKTDRFFVIADFFSTVDIGMTELQDNGENGDRVINDRVYSASLTIPKGTILSFRFGQFQPSKKKWTEEFDRWRIYRQFDVKGPARSVAGSNPTIATPIYRFNNLSQTTSGRFTLKPLMAEVCHPNEKGHEVIAKGLTQTLSNYIRWNSEIIPDPAPEIDGW